MHFAFWWTHSRRCECRPAPAETNETEKNYRNLSRPSRMSRFPVFGFFFLLILHYCDLGHCILYRASVWHNTKRHLVWMAMSPHFGGERPNKKERRCNFNEIYVEDYVNILYSYENVICDFNSNIYALIHNSHIYWNFQFSPPSDSRRFNGHTEMTHSNTHTRAHAIELIRAQLHESSVFVQPMFMCLCSVKYCYLTACL